MIRYKWVVHALNFGVPSCKVNIKRSKWRKEKCYTLQANEEARKEWKKTKVKNNNFVELKIPKKKYWTCIKHISDTKQKHNK